MFRKSLLTAFALTFPASESLAQSACGGGFGTFIAQMKEEARIRNYDPETVEAFFTTVQKDGNVLRADRAQGVFKRSFLDFSQHVISQDRLTRGIANAKAQAAVFDRIEAEYGVPRGVMLSFWALETDYGAVQGDFNTLNALVTLAHDCRRPDLFRPQVFAALDLYRSGNFDPATTTGAWAGEIGQVQILPEDIIRNGVDGDGDGLVSVKTSAPDALMSGAKILASLGWRAGEPWLQEVTVPEGLDWSRTGLRTKLDVAQWKALQVKPRSGSFEGTGPASLLLPQGRKGPAFLAYPNFEVFFEWNQSFVYVTTAAYFATRLSGAPPYDAGDPDPGLNEAEMIALQVALQERGYDVGMIDGILGARTRAAVQDEQARTGRPADAWPTRELLDDL